MNNTAKPQKKYVLTGGRRITLDYAICLSACLFFAVSKNGGAAVFLSAVSIITCLIGIKLGEKILKTDFSSRFLIPVVIGLSVALMFPATAPWWMVVCTALFAVAVGVLPFGSPEKSPFVPAAVGVCFAMLCWREEFFVYSSTDASITSLLSQNNSIGKNIAAVLEVLMGNIPSAMGTGCIIILLASLVFITIRRPNDSVPVYTFLLAAAVMALLFPRVGTGRIISLVMELCGGMLLYSAVFFISMPSVMPERLIPRAVWGFAGGIICMLIRYMGEIEESAVFGVLITCAIGDFFDKLPLTKKEKALIKAQKEEPSEVLITVVPDEVLEEIPDISEETEEKSEETVKAVEEKEDISAQESESLEEVINEENTVTETDAPFMTGGGDNE